MTHDSDDSRRGMRDPRSRYSSDDRFDRDRFDRDDRSERGFFDRAGDEISSWFGDEEAERRRRMDAGRDDANDSTRYDRQARFRDEGYRRPYTGRFSGGRGFGQDYGPDRAAFNDRWDRGSTQRHPERQSAGSAAGLHDPHYAEWRSRQIEALDRDYDEYRRENQSRFEGDFANWRSRRQTKRQLLGEVREHMEVIGSDEQHVGTVDKVRGDRLILTKSDSGDGQHHAVNCSMVDRVEGDRVVLDKPAEEAKSKLSSETRDRALFERDDDREPGAHMLNRSFSGTY